MYQCSKKKAIFSVILAVILLVCTMSSSILDAAGTNDYRTWKQHSSSWSSMQMGTSGKSVAKIGCAVTSAAILMVHSGSVEDENFDPGVLVDYMNRNGGFDCYGNIQWSVLTKYSPEFSFVSAPRLSGTQGQKTQQIREYLEQGYYVMARVKNRQHFVAIDCVSGKKVVMMDPDKSSDSLFGTYDASGVTELRIFRGADSYAAPTTPTEPATEETTVMTTTTETTTATETTTSETTTTSEMTTASETTTTETTTTELTTTTVMTTTTTAASETTKQTTTTTAATTKATTKATTAAPVKTEPAEPAKMFEIGGKHFFMTLKFTLTDNLNLREYADTVYDILTVIPKGTEVKVIEVNEDFTWGKVSYDGKTGWIYLDYASLHNQIEDVLSE